MRIAVRTLSARLFLLNAVWALISVALIAVVLTEAYRRNAESQFGDLITANLYNLMGIVEPDPNGRLAGAPEFRDPRYQLFNSGWYWAVSAEADAGNRLTSQSLSGGGIPSPQDLPFDDTFQRRYTYTDATGQSVSVVEARVILGSGNAVYSFRVTGNKAELDADISAFRQIVIGLLSIFALGFVIVAWLLVRIGLRPLTGATSQLAGIREGRAELLDGEFPLEIQPLIDETNALIRSNKAVVERARTQVGNLAHSLKTPLAVLANEARNADQPLSRLLQEQTGQMRRQIDVYLNRARIAARHATITSRTDVVPLVQRLVRVMGKLNPNLQFEFDPPSPAPKFAGEQEDFEEILGNLLENAARYAKSVIRIEMRQIAAEGQPQLVVSVGDDGKGMTPAECEIALKRGTRLDESTPGSGLGLSIVRDVSAEYKGSLALSRSPAGGLLATVILPAV